MKLLRLPVIFLILLTIFSAACTPGTTPAATTAPPLAAEPTATLEPAAPTLEPTVAAEAAATTAATTEATAAAGAQEPASAESPISVTDATGYEVILDAPAQKVISLGPSNTEILFAVGAGEQVVGRDMFSNYPEQASEIFDVGGDMGSFNLEEIARLEPDLILGTPLTSPEVMESMKQITPNVFVVPNPTKLDDLYANLIAVGELTGHKAEGEALAVDLRARADAVIEKASSVKEKPTVYYELDASDPAKPWTPGPGTFIDMLISLAGGQNIGASLSGEWAQISQEELIVQDPDFILLGNSLPIYGGMTPEQVAARPGWDVLTAVQEGRVLPFNDDLVSRPGPRMVDGLEELAKVLHPDLFQ